MNPDGFTTPYAVVDRERLSANLATMNAQARRLGVALRPHVKTAKAIEPILLAHGGQPGPITVSTLREAEFFAQAGFEDILYAVSLSPDKIERALAVRAVARRFTVTVDNVEVSHRLDQAARAAKLPIMAAIEVDSDGHRAGLNPQDPVLVEVAGALAGGRGTRFRGVMTHAGESYHMTGNEALAAHAELERRMIVAAADHVRRAGIACDMVSLGSTPTLAKARSLDGVSEARAGVYMFGDLVQANIGTCRITDIALSIATTVISHQLARGILVVDAGGLALSKDRGTGDQATDFGYGLVCDAGGDPIKPWLKVDEVMQEHGMIRLSNPADFARYPIGTTLRILPNHACMTAAAHDRYRVVGADGEAAVIWQRCNGW